MTICHILVRVSDSDGCKYVNNLLATVKLVTKTPKNRSLGKVTGRPEIAKADVTLKVTQGQWQCQLLIDHIWLPISILY